MLRATRPRASFLDTMSRCWIAEEMYGWKFAPSMSRFEYPFFYAKCVLYVSSCNGSTHAQHRRWVNGLVQTSYGGNADPSLVEFVANFVKEGQEAPTMNDPAVFGTEHARQRLCPLQFRLVLYDALKAASVFDGEYQSHEVTDASHIAKEFGVPRTVVHRISVICVQEFELAERKRKLLFSAAYGNEPRKRNKH